MYSDRAELSNWRAIPPAVQKALLRTPPLSRAAAGLHTMNQERADLRDVAKMIGTDPALSSLVLRLVNSPLFGVWQPVTGVLQAVALLGLDRVRALTTTAALRMLVGLGTSSPALTRCWRHSVACALASQEMAVDISFDADTAYTAGLLHDIGCFAMLGCWPKEYSSLLATCRPSELCEREAATLGVSHTDAGAFLLERWGLPAKLVAAAQQHHHPAPEHKSSLVQLVSWGCRLADALGFTATGLASEDDVQNDPELAMVCRLDGFNFRIADGINQLECL